MADGRIPDGEASDEALRRALLRAEEEARPRAEFRERLRDGFVEGRLEPRAEVESAPASAPVGATAGKPAPVAPEPELAPAPAPGPAPVPSPRRLAIPRWAAYPAAAAVLLAALAAAAQFRADGPPEPILPKPPVVSPADQAMAAAERRLAADPVLGGRTWQRRLVQGRPWLFPAEAVSADPAEIEVISKAMAEAESSLGRLLEGARARHSLPVVAVVAPTREAFEALAMPLVDPMPLSEYTIAFGLRAQRVLLISPETLAPGGPPCEEMDIVHEAAHAWLHVRMEGATDLPLWVDEGLAEAVSARGYDGKEACRNVLSQLRGVGLDPYAPAQVLGAKDFKEVAEIAKAAAPCDTRPYSLAPAFHMHSQSLAGFLLEDEPAGRREAFLRWLDRALSGERTDPDATARALGFESAEALLAARDAWLGL